MSQLTVHFNNRIYHTAMHNAYQFPNHTLFRCKMTTPSRGAVKLNSNQIKFRN